MTASAMSIIHKWNNWIKKELEKHRSLNNGMTVTMAVTGNEALSCFMKELFWKNSIYMDLKQKNIEIIFITKRCRSRLSASVKIGLPGRFSCERWEMIQKSYFFKTSPGNSLCREKAGFYGNFENAWRKNVIFKRT